jgi:hypothetical protein
MGPPFGSTGVHVGADGGHSLLLLQTWYVAQSLLQLVPVKSEMYGNAGVPPSPHAGWGPCSSMVPVPQQTVPSAQSSAPSHCQRVASLTGQLSLLLSHVESWLALSGGSQHSLPAAQTRPSPPSGLLKGQ